MNKAKSILIRLSDDAYADLSAIAGLNDISVPAYCKELIERYMLTGMDLDGNAMLLLMAHKHKCKKSLILANALKEYFERERENHGKSETCSG